MSECVAVRTAADVAVLHGEELERAAEILSVLERSVAEQQASLLRQLAALVDCSLEQRSAVASSRRKTADVVASRYVGRTIGASRGYDDWGCDHWGVTTGGVTGGVPGSFWKMLWYVSDPPRCSGAPEFVYVHRAATSAAQACSSTMLALAISKASIAIFQSSLGYASSTISSLRTLPHRPDSPSFS